MFKPEIAVIINSFNRLDLLQKSLSSLITHLNKDFKERFVIVIFEAGSTDGSMDFINEVKKEFAFIDIITPTANESSSFSAGINKASNFAIQNYPTIQFLFFYETDNFLLSHQSFKHAYSLLKEKKDLGTCGFTVKKHDGSFAGSGCPFPTIFSFILGQQMSAILKLDNPPLNFIQNKDYLFSYMDVVYTSPLLIKKEAFEAVEGMDSTNFPFSDCDIDFAIRLRKAGFYSAVIKSEDVLHDNLSNSSAWSNTRVINFHNARFKYIKKYNKPNTSVLKSILFCRHSIELLALLFFGFSRPYYKKSLGKRLKLVKICFNEYKV